MNLHFPIWFDFQLPKVENNFHKLKSKAQIHLTDGKREHSTEPLAQAVGRRTPKRSFGGSSLAQGNFSSNGGNLFKVSMGSQMPTINDLIKT